MAIYEFESVEKRNAGGSYDLNNPSLLINSGVDRIY